MFNKDVFEEYLSKSLDDYPNGKVKEAALYSLMNGGKRVRPQLLFSVMEAYHNDYKKGFNAAVAIEMMHTYSLIHDDLPCMDNDTMRRGKPTCHIQYGESTAVLAGDALLTHAFTYASKSHINNKVANKIVGELASSGGIEGMIYGQELDLINEGNKSITLEDLEKINYYKTGKLIACPMVMGAMLVGKFDDVEAWREIGHLIGLLFQIQDDVFDVTKTTSELGKNANSDQDNDKITYVTLLGVEKCNEVIKELYDKAISLLDGMNIDTTPILQIFDYLLNRSN